MHSAKSVPAVQLASVAHRYGLQRRHPQWLRPAGIAFGGDASEVSAAGETSGRRDERMQRVEAVLFLAREPLSSRKLGQYANLADGTEARTLVRLLNEHYDRAGRAFRVEEIAGGFQLLTRPQFAPWLRRLAHVPRETRLSAPSLETLAVVAYRQPVAKSTVDAIRGVNCGEILRQLLERDLIRIDGRSEELGRPYLYSTTRRFLQLFGLRGIDELPGSAAGVLAGRAGGPAAEQASQPLSSDERPIEEDSNVKVIFPADLHPDDMLPDSLTYGEFGQPRAMDDDDDLDDEDDDLDDDDDDSDLDDEDDDDLDEDFDDDFDDEDDEEDDDEEDEDLEDADWKEVDDEEEDDEEEDEDDDDDDWDDDEEEEEDDEDDDD